MRIERNPTALTVGPYPKTGNLIIRENSNTDHQRVASFAEYGLPKLVDPKKKLAVNFTPTNDAAYFWVSAASQTLVDTTLDKIEEALKRK